MVRDELGRGRGPAAKFRRLAAIGHGGMADVYLAAARGVGGALKLLVLKELRPALARDPEYRAMFQREARIAALLAHPNTVQVYEVGSEEGRPFIAMEYLEGQPMHRVLRRLNPAPPEPRGLPLAMHLRIIVELLAGLHYAHELRDLDGQPLALVHRDVTPHNVLVTYDGQVKLVDFGIARLGDDADTQVGTFKGKAAYASPEQVRGATLDRRSDIFSVGVMLWEALTRQRMWQGHDELAIARRLEAGDVPPLPAGVRTSPALRTIVAAALAPDPDARPATADALREALEASLGELDPAGPRAIGALVADAFADDREALRCVVEQQVRRARAVGDELAPIELAEATCSEDQDSGGAAHPDERTRPDGLPGGEATADPHQPDPRERHEATWTGVAPPAPPRRRASWPGWLAGGALGAVATWVALRTGFEGHVLGDIAAGVATGDACARADRPIVELSGDIERAARLTCDKVYRLRAAVYVRPGASLTIDPGTTIVGDRATGGTLVVQPGGRLFAEGSAARPIVFTSEAPLGERRPGDWGGLVLLGRAPTNARGPGGARVEGIAVGGEYGGDDPEDSSGALRYVRVEYAGIELGPNNETNGITFAGVGRGTIVDHVQVRRPADDCFEFFGGTVDARHLVCQDPGDDAFDWDFGYTGRLQFLLSRDGTDAPGASVGLEGDSDLSGAGARPRSAPTIANVTLCGRGRPTAREHYGALLRSGTTATLGNLVMMGFEAPLDVRDRGTSLALFGGLWLARSFAAPLAYAEVRRGVGPLADDDGGLDEAGLLAGAGAHTDDLDLPGCADAGGQGRYKPLAPLLDGAAAPPDDGFFDRSARWAGAFRDAEDAWDEGWVVWADPHGDRP